MYKPTWQIYINNSIAFILFSILNLLFRRNKKKSNRILFINTGQIGDLIVSSVIFTNEKLLTEKYKVSLLIRERYLELYDDYKGDITIIPWNYSKYKYNLFYRISFLRSLHKQGFDLCVNVTAARGITNDEIALLSGAGNVMCLNNNWKYLTKLFGKRMDSYYDRVISFGTINEPERNKKLLEYLLNAEVSPLTSISISESTKENAFQKFRNIKNIQPKFKKIIIAPISDGSLRNWPMESFKELCRRVISENDVIIYLIGTKDQRSTLNSIAEIDKNKIKNLAGNYSILESAAILNESSLFIGNDSGFTHIAKALGKKFIGIIGGGCYGLFFPYNQTNQERLFYYQLDCFGCEWRCHLDEPYCVTNVTVSEVYTNVLKLLDQ